MKSKKEYKIVTIQDLTNNSPMVDVLNKTEIFEQLDKAVAHLNKHKRSDIPHLIIEIDYDNNKKESIVYP